MKIGEKRASGWVERNYLPRLVGQTQITRKTGETDGELIDRLDAVGFWTDTRKPLDPDPAYDQGTEKLTDIEDKGATVGRRAVPKDTADMAEDARSELATLDNPRDAEDVLAAVQAALDAAGIQQTVADFLPDETKTRLARKAQLRPIAAQGA